ncbi:hypothetical protein BDQ17DRAFT_1323975 [Cyathus striatus]|nr:hypothetical protein BDQ17DRAFT_1323975 [Cyathus striatus]
MPGWGPHVEEEHYQTHLTNHKENPEINTCNSEHEAILQAGTFFDSQKQSRYCNVDYILLSTLKSVSLPWIMVTYDIGLTLLWHISQELGGHVVKRLKQHGPAVTIFIPVHVRWVQLCVMRKLLTFISKHFLKHYNEAVTMNKWEHQIKVWNESHTGPNPYHEPECRNRLQDIRLELTKEEAVAAEKGIPPKHKISLTKFILLAFELEEQQHILKLQISKMKKELTSKHEADIQHYGNLSSQIHLAQSALSKLDPNGEWKTYLHELKSEDISGPGKDPDDMSSNGQFEISWIWLVPHASSKTNNDDDKMNESLRVEWAKSHARRDRQTEELLILKEEMQRVIQYFEWKTEWWKSLADVRTYESSTGIDIKQGVKAYVLKQASICQKLAQSCADWWLPAFKKQNYTPEWAEKYIRPITSEDYCWEGRKIQWMNKMMKMI